MTCWVLVPCDIIVEVKQVRSGACIVKKADIISLQEDGQGRAATEA